MSIATYTAKVGFTGQYDGSNRPTITWNPSGGPVASGGVAQKIKSIKTSTEPMAEIDEQTDENSGCVGFIKKPKGPKRKTTLECVVQADTKANAALALVAPPDLTEIVLANFISTSEAQMNGAYVYKTGMKVELGEDDTAKISVELYQYATAAATLLAATT